MAEHCRNLPRWCALG
uniref:Uncharacterized protein n=1 Tax=Arundo donax TaxID=35708 RepID=A0A0A9C415_ARUDO